MKKIFTLISLSSSLIWLSSCSKGSAFEGYTKADNGLYYKFYKHDENGEKPKIGYGVAFKFVIKTQAKDSVIVDSKNVSQDGTGITKFLLQKSSFQGSLEDGLLMMAKNDSASFIISADSFYFKTQNLKELPKGIAPGSYLNATIVLKDFFSQKQIEEMQAKQMEEQRVKMKEFEAKDSVDFAKYLSENKIKTKANPSGLIYIETKKGDGKHPSATDVVKVHYTGTLMDGKKFDSSVDRGQPAEFPLNQVIAGWTEGIQLMSKGGKAKLIIPSKLGYGPQGMGQTIPPFSTLIFEVELLDFKPAPPQPAAQPGAQQQQHSAGDGHNH